MHEWTKLFPEDMDYEMKTSVPVSYTLSNVEYSVAAELSISVSQWSVVEGTSQNREQKKIKSVDM